ncbi:MAG: hypothetical protein AABX69_02000 [Nanoarchaeota archaeon]
MTISTIPETIPWGRRIRVISSEVAAFFYNKRIWKALEDALKLANENCGRIESAHGILERRIQEPLEGPSWQWLTANYEEDIGLDTEGRFGKKGEAVILAIQGGGIMLSSPQRLEETYTNRTPKGEPSLTQPEITQALAGMLPDGQQLKVYTLQSLAKENPKHIPQTYAIVMPLKDLGGIKSGTVAVRKLLKILLFVMRAGHPTTAKDYAKTLRKAHVSDYGNNHSLRIADPENPSGRVLHVSNHPNNGFVSIISRDYFAGFVGVRPVLLAEGTAAQKCPLEELVGKGTDEGNAVVIVRKDQISLEAYRALTNRR